MYLCEGSTNLFFFCFFLISIKSNRRRSFFNSFHNSHRCISLCIKSSYLYQSHRNLVPQRMAKSPWQKGDPCATRRGTFVGLALAPQAGVERTTFSAPIREESLIIKGTNRIKTEKFKPRGKLNETCFQEKCIY